MKYKLYYNLTSSSSHYWFIYALLLFILFWKAVFNLCFNIFIYSLTILQPVTPSTSILMNNVLILIQSYYLHYIYQIAHFANVYNITNVYQCNYYHLLNKFCCLVSSMQDVGKLLMSRKFCLILTLLLIAFYIRTVTLIIR